jgi:hypothetical protein
MLPKILRRGKFFIINSSVNYATSDGAIQKQFLTGVSSAQSAHFVGNPDITTFWTLEDRNGSILGLRALILYRCPLFPFSDSTEGRDGNFRASNGHFSGD